MSDPNDFRVVSIVGGGFIIVDKDGFKIEPSIIYATEDDAENAISKMLDEHEQEVRERRRDEDEAPHRGPTFGASYGANSAGRT